MKKLLEISNLSVQIENKTILNDINLSINYGEIHAIMGPNGAGKTTLSNVLAGKDDYKITSGKIIFKGENLLNLSIDERASAGLFLSFQYPVEIPGVNNVQFIATAINNMRKARGQDKLSTIEIMKKIRQNMKTIGIDNEYMKRDLNVGFSGGEKKRNEILHMMMLRPELCILDEADSGLDIDVLKIMSQAIKRNDKQSFVIITHYQNLLKDITPNFVHILVNGKIVMSGDYELSLRIKKEGYTWIKN